MEVDHTAQTIAEEQPDVAVRLVRAKLDFLLSEARAKPEPPPFPEAGTEEEKTTWYFQHRRTKEIEELRERSEWNGLPAIAENDPAELLSGLRPSGAAGFLAILSRLKYEGVGHVLSRQ